MAGCRIPEHIIERISTPSYVVDLGAMEDNLRLLADVRERCGCEILLALKGFAMFGVFELVKKYLAGVSASSVNEAHLGFEEFGGQVHVVMPAYKRGDFDKLLNYADHVVFNSFSQWEKYREQLAACGKRIEAGLRINPEYSEVEVEIYNPCAQNSRFGIKAEDLKGQSLDGIDGLHFHTMCEQDCDTLERTLAVVEEKFGVYLRAFKWVNFGGGHHITRDDYDVDKLCKLITDFRRRYVVDIFLEPGEAVALNTGVLVASVVDIMHNETDIAIVDSSAAAHMPDVLEMPYRPEVEGAGQPGEKAFTYRLGGMTCLAGDVIGDYSFDEPLQPGSKLIFGDMAHYTMVKNNTFNGINLPSIATYDPKADELKIIRQFGYEDYKNRLS